MKKIIFSLGLLYFLLTSALIAQEKLPFYEIPAAPESYTSANVMGRLVDGLGFRYYWATEGLTEKDLGYVPRGADARSVRETLEHLHGLATTISTTIEGKAMERPRKPTPESFAEMRAETLLLLKKASDTLKDEQQPDLAALPIKFKRGDQVSEFPFWNLINGPIADAIYHAGQIVVFRRGAGNPIDPTVNVFIGKRMGQ